MPLQDGLLIAVKDGVVEMTATLVEPHHDDPEDFGHALQERLAEHQYQAMTDDAIMGDDLALASCIVCRDPVPEPLKDPLVKSGFLPETTPGAGQSSSSLFGRLGSSKQRSRLEKWSVRYMRSADVDPQLAALETSISDALPPGELAEVADVGTQLVVAAAQAHFRLPLASRLESLQALERHLDRFRRSHRGRWVLHASAVRALAGFTAACIRAHAPHTRWSPDPEDDSPLWVKTARGVSVETDPEYRVVEFVRRGLRSSLTSYVQDVIRQSENR